jgi:hypothetical protein
LLLQLFDGDGLILMMMMIEARRVIACGMTKRAFLHPDSSTLISDHRVKSSAW